MNGTPSGRPVSEVVADLRGLADHNVYRQRLACEAAALLERLDADVKRLSGTRSRPGDDTREPMLR